MTERVGSGLLAGVLAGTIWWLVECGANWALGGTLPLQSALAILALDVACGTAGGALVSGAAGARTAPALAVALALVYGFVRIVEPPGMRSELVFVALAAPCGFLGVRLAGRERRGLLAFTQLTAVMTAATVFGKAHVAATESYFAETEPSGLVLVLLLLGLPLAGLLADRLLAALVPRDAARFGVELGAGALALVLAGSPASTAALDAPGALVPSAPGAPDVILVSLDTTRADHLSTYGYARETSPHLTELARDALSFTEARAPADWTVPGHASMLTGLYPSRHGAHSGTGRGARGSSARVHPLGDDEVTLAEALREYGYRTGGFVANFGALYRGFGMAQGFDHYEDAPGVLLRPVPHVVRLAQRFDPTFMKRPFRSAREIVAAALGWMDTGPRARPAFLFLNFMEPHHWNVPPRPFDHWAREVPGAFRLARKGLFTHRLPIHLAPEERAFVAAAYDGQIAAMDAALGELWTGLRARGRYENALVVVTADHGELLGEHDEVGHGGRMLYEGILHIPLVLKLPGAERPRGEVHEPAQLVDILPTVLDGVGVPIPPGVQGDRLPRVRHAIVAEEHINPALVAHFGAVYDRGIRVVYDGPWKLVETSRGERLLFDLTRDPDEAENLVAREPERVAALERRLEATLGLTSPRASGENDPSGGPRRSTCRGASETFVAASTCVSRWRETTRTRDTWGRCSARCSRTGVAGMRSTSSS